MAVNWSKTIAEEIIKAGYRQLTKKFHPDAGGSHDEMIVLKATAEHLAGVLNGTASSGQRQQTNDWRRQEKTETRRERWTWKARKPDPEATGEMKMREHKRAWFAVDDVLCVRVTDKAIQVKFPDVPMPQWLPKSQLHQDDNEVWEEDQRGTLVFSRWIAQQKGWA